MKTFMNKNNCCCCRYDNYDQLWCCYTDDANFDVFEIFAMRPKIIIIIITKIIYAYVNKNIENHVYYSKPKPIFT